jgi:hypothetical protein
MNRLSPSIAPILVAAASAGLTFVGPAYAADASIVVTGTLGDAVPVRNSSDRKELAGVYQLSDGRLLTLHVRHGVTEAVLEGRPDTLRLRPTNGTTLSTDDRRTTMRFSRVRDEPMQVTLSTSFDGGVPQVLSALAAPMR